MINITQFEGGFCFNSSSKRLAYESFDKQGMMRIPSSFTLSYLPLTQKVPCRFAGDYNPAQFRAALSQLVGEDTIKRVQRANHLRKASATEEEEALHTAVAWYLGQIRAQVSHNKPFNNAPWVQAAGKIITAAAQSQVPHLKLSGTLEQRLNQIEAHAFPAPMPRRFSWSESYLSAIPKPANIRHVTYNERLNLTVHTFALQTLLAMLAHEGYSVKESTPPVVAEKECFEHYFKAQFGKAAHSEPFIPRDWDQGRKIDAIKSRMAPPIRAFRDAFLSLYEQNITFNVEMPPLRDAAVKSLKPPLNLAEAHAVFKAKLSGLTDPVDIIDTLETELFHDTDHRFRRFFYEQLDWVEPKIPDKILVLPEDKPGTSFYPPDPPIIIINPGSPPDKNPEPAKTR